MKLNDGNANPKDPELTPTYSDIVDFLKTDFSAPIRCEREIEVVGLLCRSPIGDIEICVRRSEHNGDVFVEVNMAGLGYVIPPVASAMTELINELNYFGLGGVVMVLEGVVMFRQSIAVEQEHQNCWQSRLRFMLVQGLQNALRVKLYLSRNLADADLDDTGDAANTTDTSLSSRIDPSWN